ncbi:hypothetical protein BDC45DRAFT_100594 [Circinella umbellata]|nr:hypothetical protein BDC45DRAFT_100594 [Circinella umbellata]
MLTERGPPKDYDIPSTIVIYILVIMLGVGMCFCLRRANRLLPNQRSFQLRPTSTTQRRGYDIADEEQGDPESRTGLLSAGYDEEEEEEDENNHFMNRREDRRRVGDYDPDELEDCEEEFGDMQGASSPSSPTNDSNNNDKPRTPLFGIVDDDDDDDDEDNSDNEQREIQQKKKDKIK